MVMNVDDAVVPTHAEIESAYPGRYVRIMCDFSAEGVWAKSGGSTSVDLLPVTPETIARLWKWQDWYERLFEGQALRGETLELKALRNFTAEGLSIAREVKRQLPDWTVVYYDEAAGEQATPEDFRERRQSIEYEIHLC